MFFNFTNFRTLWAAVRSSGEGEVRENEKMIKKENNKFMQFVQYLKKVDFLVGLKGPVVSRKFGPYN